MFKKSFTALLISITLLAWSNQIFANLNLIEVNLLPESVVQKGNYTLGEISEIDGYDMQVLDELSRFKVGMSPIPGIKQKLVPVQIERKLKRKFPELEVRVQADQESFVKVDSTEITEGEIRRIILDKMAENSDAEDFQILSKLPKIFLQAGNVTHEVVQTGRNLQNPKVSNWRISFYVDRKIARSVYVRVSSADFLVDPAKLSSISGGQQTASLEPDENIQPIVRSDAQDVAVSTPAPKKVFKSKPADFLKRKQQAIQRGKPDILRGRKVILRYESPNIELKTLAKTMESGKIGDVIRVLNLTSNKTVEAEIMEKNSVRVIF